MHPNGQIPAYEFDLGDVNPPVHAWACWRVYKMTAPRGERDWRFLSSTFQKLLINFTWWVNRKDARGKHLFSGGFLGLDNIGVFDRSRPLPNGGHLEQADGTAWMAFYCATMLAMALELSRFDPAAEDIASKFFEHFVYIADAINTIGGTGLWDEEDGFYYDQLYVDGRRIPLRVRSMVGLIPLFTVQVLTDELIGGLAWVPETSRLVPHLSSRSGQAHFLHGDDGRERLAGPSPAGNSLAAATGDECSAMCSTKTSFSPPTAFARSRSITATTPTSFVAAVRSSGWSTFPGNRARTSLAATPTGAARSGSP